MNVFESLNWANALLQDYSDSSYPTRLHAWIHCNKFEEEGSTFFGIATRRSYIETSMGHMVLEPGMYFSASDYVYITGGHGILIERVGFKGMPMVGGPVEPSGRLKYIDGCTDSLLVPPVKMGDPCLNALYFPADIDQTEHTHPSIRVGIVLSGKGECIADDTVYPLVPETIFVIHEEGLHKFRTLGTDGMVVIAYHPDSDFGPVDEEHPMINRTIVDGTSAREIEEIRTR